MGRVKVAAAALAILVVSLAVAACGGDDSASGSSAREAPNASGSTLPQGSEPVKLDPADFTTKIDNPHWPMQPGNKWVYRETDTEGGVAKVVVKVTDKTKTIANGVEAVVVSDIVSEDGKAIEITDDWYAQDKQGNIWYLGEDTAEYENGKVKSRAGSFEAGADGALPGIIMPAEPRPGLEYRQEYYKGEAEDEAAVVSVGKEQVEVPAGHFTDVVMTRDFVPIEPKVQEFAFYARGVGPIMAAGVSGGTPGFEELVRFTEGK